MSYVISAPTRAEASRCLSEITCVHLGHKALPCVYAQRPTSACYLRVRFGVRGHGHIMKQRGSTLPGTIPTQCWLLYTSNQSGLLLLPFLCMQLTVLLWPKPRTTAGLGIDYCTCAAHCATGDPGSSPQEGTVRAMDYGREPVSVGLGRVRRANGAIRMNMGWAWQDGPGELRRGR